MQKYKAPTFDEYNKVMANVEKTKMYSNPQMTKYEFDLLISTRTNMLSLGAKPFVDVSGLKTQSNMELRKVALREFKEGKMPFIIKRTLPNNKFEYYRIRDMDLTKIIPMMRDDGL
jgi:DNA-directed RNA polymerase subunit K/omega